MKSKIIIFSVLLIIANTIYAYDFSAVCSTGQTLYFNILTDSTVEVTFTYSGYATFYYSPTPVGNLVIPDSVLYDSVFYKVTQIGEHSFDGCGLLSSVTIPNSVTVIAAWAFYNCSGIDSLFIGSGVVSIGMKAFSGCNSLEYMYYNAKNLATPLFGSGGYGIGSDYIPFYNTSTPNFTTLVLGDSVLTIPHFCFYGRSSIDSLYIGSSVVSIESSAFFGCTGLKYLYYNAKNLGTIYFMSNNYVYNYDGSLRYSPFYNTSTPNFTTLVIGDSVDTIPTGCFCDRLTLSRITIPEGIICVNDAAFVGCSGLDSIEFNARECMKMNYSVFYGCNNIDYLGIGEKVKRFPDSAFTLLNHLFDTIPNRDSLRYVGKRNFMNWNHVGNLVIPQNIDTIEEGAFYDCDNIVTVNVNNQYIGNMVFAGCDRLTQVVIGDSVQDFGVRAFANCDSLTVVTINAQHIGQSAFADCDRLSQAVFGDRVQMIGDSAFYNCDNLLLVNPNAQFIGNWAFAYCDRLSQVIFSNRVQMIGDSAFYNCDNLLSVNPNAQSIGTSAFADCDSLLTVNTNSRSIGNNAFADCDRLVSVTLGDSVRTLGSGAFRGCFRLNNVSLGEGITSIGDSAFGGCIRLTKPELPGSLATIGARAFDGCGDINGKLTFPASITHIGDYAYNGVGNITEIEMKGYTPPTIQAHTFAAVDSLVTVSVPCGAVLNYYITDYWENFPNIVEAPPYRLTVQSNNEVMGTATVTQQTTCSNHTATIYAVAQTGYHFLQWNDGITANPRTVPMTQDSAFTAIFVVNNSYITVHANDSTMGSVSGTGLYGYNAPVTLTATAYSGYHFLRWSDGNTQNPRYLAAVRDSVFTAIFVSNVSTITVANANPDMGNVSGSGVYYYQNLVSLTATANYGYHFVQWQDGNTQNPRTILVSQDSTFTAYFALNTYSIVATSNSTTMGSVSGGGQYTYLHEMSMTATPAYGYHFVQWNDGVTDNPRTITVTRDSAFTAQFAANSYTLTVAPNDATMGSAYGAGSYNYNTTATLTAVPNYGYHFTQWSDAVTDNPRTVTVQNNATYTAQFEINSYIITVQSSNPAIGTTSGSGSYNYLTPVNITALPNAGYHFTQWSDGNTDTPRLISVTANATYTAQFAINSYAVGVTSNNSTMGSVSGSGTYNHNSTATLTATPYYGYHFVQWQDGNTQNPRTVVVTDSAQYTAQFDYNSYLVTALSSNVMLGTATGGGSYNYLSQVALTAVPAPHYHFTMWNDSVEDNPRTLTVTRDTTLTAHFAIDRHTIGVNTANATQGTVSGSDTVDYNTPVWITATPNYGYHFTQWQDGNSSNPRRVVVSQDTVFTATFVPNQYTATCMANDNTRGSVTSAGGSYNYLTSITFTALPNAGYHFLRWSNGSTDNPITFTLTKDTALTAIFVGLTANVNDNLLGTAFHTKLANLVEEVTATPNYGYHFVQWQDGNSDNPRTVTLTQDTTMTAYFAVNTYYLTLVSNDSTMGTVTGSGSYNYLTQVTLTATANEHYHFVQWNDGNTTNPRLVTVTSDSTFMAQFEEDARYTITVHCNDTAMGTAAGSGTYYGGEQVVLTASPRAHHHFVGWGDGNTQNPRTITVVGNADYTAVFEADRFTITVTANDPAMGSVTGGGEYGYGTEVTIAAQPFANYGFRGWSDGDTNRVRTIVVTEDASYQAIFYDMVGISDVAAPDYAVVVERNSIHIKGVNQRKVAVYDITGRRIAHIDKGPETFSLTVPAAGVYLIQVEGMRARKVMVY